VGAVDLAKRFTRGRFLLNRINAVARREVDEHRPDELIRLLRESALGLPRDVPVERLRVALPFTFVAPPINSLWHVRGVKVVATDIGWSAGLGPEARGTAEAVLTVMGGRRGVDAELTGPGAPRLEQRLG
jgi:hypothetical protein